MKIQIFASTAVLTCEEVSVELLEQMKILRPEALTLKRQTTEGTEEYFKMDYGTKSSIDKFGVIFAVQGGKLKAKANIPESITEDEAKKRYIKEQFMSAVANCNMIIKQIEDAKLELEVVFESLEEMIEILG